MLQINDAAPDFKAKASDGQEIKLSDFKDKKNVILFFYPKAFSPACTREACHFRDTYESLISTDSEILGISFDTPEKNREFKNANGLPFRLISDSDKGIARVYGVMRLGGFLPFVKRVTFVIDRSGIIRNVIHHEYNIANHVREVRKTLEKMANTN